MKQDRYLSPNDSDQTAIDQDKKNSYLFSLDFGSNKTYSGRKDTVAQPYLAPDFTFTNKKDFYVYISTYRLQKQFDNANLGFGKDFRLPKKFKLGLSFAHTIFFNKESPQPSFYVSNNLDFFVKKKFNWLTTKLAFDMDFGRNEITSKKIVNGKITTVTKNVFIRDFGLTWSNYRAFYFDRIHLFSKNDELSVTPKFLINAGTQNAYILYYAARYPSRQAKLEADPELKEGIKKIRDPSKPDPFNDTKFLILNYEFKLSLTYSVKKFTFEPVIHFAMPRNQPDPSDNKPYAYYAFNASWDF